MTFADRRDAGRRLATALSRMRGMDAVVLALPRGGVPVGYEVARSLGAPLDVVLVRKIGAPGNPELGIGSVIDGETPRLVLDDGLVRLVRPPPGYVEEEMARQLALIERRRQQYRDVRPAVSPEGRTLIVVDDGIATGGTARAALRGLRARRPHRLVLAAPVAAPETLPSLRREADEIVCLVSPAGFQAVGEAYADFAQTSDEEVTEFLRAGRVAGEDRARRRDRNGGR